MEALTRKQQKGRSSTSAAKAAEEEAIPATLIAKPRDYIVKFRFPNPPPLQPPVLGLYNVNFGYPGQPPLFKNIDFGGTQNQVTNKYL